jgi:methylenetetrahydrofolate dehydrogenase (NADP+) / methenyltetrahydrofolate cyclohydrolase
VSATILDGRAMAAEIQQELRDLASERAAELSAMPELAMVAVHEAGASAGRMYLRQLARVARATGIVPRQVILPHETAAADLLDTLRILNADPAVHGIVVQLPLPPHISRDALLDAIAPEKDVDGISATSAGNLFLRQPAFVPATCAAVMELLDRARIPLAGRRVVLVGASPVVGRPLALMLLHRDATVTVTHVYTRDLPSFTRLGEILIAAAGVPDLITRDHVREGAVVVDVGINVLPGGQVVGDVAFDDVRDVAGAISPVPGGVGPLTSLMVMRQTLAHLPSESSR